MAPTVIGRWRYQTAIIHSPTFVDFSHHAASDLTSYLYSKVPVVTRSNRNLQVGASVHEALPCEFQEA